MGSPLEILVRSSMELLVDTWIAVSNRKGSVLNFLCSVSLPACSRVCQNGGTLNPVTCMCDCADGFSGSNCESECIEWGTKLADAYYMLETAYSFIGNPTYTIL